MLFLGKNNKGPVAPDPERTTNAMDTNTPSAPETQVSDCARTHSHKRTTRAGEVRTLRRRVPLVHRRVARLCFLMQEAGLERWGIKAAIEVIRFNAHLDRYRDVVLIGGEPRRVKINNLIAPYLAREAMRRYPELDGYFETREVSHE
jgi:hypothetical protein